MEPSVSVLVASRAPKVGPNGGCTDTIVKEINGAKSEILVRHTAHINPNAKDPIGSPQAGIKGEAILDKSQKT
jgi:hypothetical protein